MRRFPIFYFRNKGIQCNSIQTAKEIHTLNISQSDSGHNCKRGVHFPCILDQLKNKQTKINYEIRSRQVTYPTTPYLGVPFCTFTTYILFSLPHLL